jgi:hypothetical protein
MVETTSWDRVTPDGGLPRRLAAAAGTGSIAAAGCWLVLWAAGADYLAAPLLAVAFAPLGEVAVEAALGAWRRRQAGPTPSARPGPPGAGTDLPGVRRDSAGAVAGVEPHRGASRAAEPNEAR